MATHIMYWALLAVFSFIRTTCPDKSSLQHKLVDTNKEMSVPLAVDNSLITNEDNTTPHLLDNSLITNEDKITPHLEYNSLVSTEDKTTPHLEDNSLVSNTETTLYQTFVDLTYNTNMNDSGCSFTDNGTTANCSFLNLTKVPQDGISYKILKFDLHSNFISKLPNYVFHNYTHLKVLDLSNNIISKLEVFAFSGLEQLKILNLWKNRLLMSDSTFHASIFSPLSQLEELKINKNTDKCKNSTGLNYPDQALSRLISLKRLYIDGLADTVFGPGFQNLTQLVNLTVAGFWSGCCQMCSLRNVTFQYLSQVQHLDISNCYIDGDNIEKDSFSSLRNLISLNLTHNEDIDIQNVDNVFYGLRKTTSLKVLSMNLIVDRYSIGICLDSFYIRNFPQHVEHFHVQENSIEGLDRQVLRKLSPSLKTLDVSGNRFVFGTYLADLHLMTNLTYLKLNGGGFTYVLPFRYRSQKSRFKTPLNCTIYGGIDAQVHDYKPFKLRLPPNLEAIEMNHAGLTYILSDLEVDPDNKLQNISMKGNKFPKLTGPFNGLHSLKHLDLSSSYVEYISDQFFLNLTSLEILKLNDNFLGDFFSSQTDAQVFSFLANLTLLDLSFNDIRSLSSNVFSGLNNLQILHLERNSLTYFSVNISHMSFLTFINLTRNRLSNLPDDIQQHIDFLLNLGQSVKIDMSQCPVSCNCENLNFLMWMKQSGAFDKNFYQYSCVYEDDTSKKVTDGYNNTVTILVRQCSPNTLLFLIVAVAMLLIFGVISYTILCRFRWKLRYLYYTAHLFFKPTKKNQQSTKFIYDAFISYDKADEHFVVGKMSNELEKRGLKLCIHGRDFLTGEYIVSNIVRAVCASRRTVVVLTDHLVRSRWCRYEIQMANQEAVYTDRKVLLFLLMKNISDSALGMELLYHIRNNTYIPYPDPLPDTTSLGILWDKLAADIRD